MIAITYAPASTVTHVLDTAELLLLILEASYYCQTASSMAWTACRYYLMCMDVYFSRLHNIWELFYRYLPWEYNHLCNVRQVGRHAMSSHS